MSKTKQRGIGKGFGGRKNPKELSEYYKHQGICVEPVLNEEGDFIHLLPIDMGGIGKSKMQFPLEEVKNNPNAKLGVLKTTASYKYKERILHSCSMCGYHFYLSVYSIQNNGAKDDKKFRYRVGHGCVKCMPKFPKDYWEPFRTKDPILNAKRMQEEIKHVTNANFTCLNPEEAKHTHNNKLLWRCDDCGHETETEFYGFVGSHKHGCKGCRGNILTEKTFKERLSCERIDLKLLTLFISTEEDCSFECLSCNGTFNASPRAILNSKQCDHCGNSTESLMAKKVKEYAIEETGLKKQDLAERTDICRNPETGYPLRPDVYIDKYERPFLLEIHGDQHYTTKGFYSSEDLLRRDQYKENFCRNEGISFLALKQSFFQKRPNEWKQIFDHALQKIKNGEYFHWHIKNKKEAKEFLKC